jgi:hypothetical protein
MIINVRTARQFLKCGPPSKKKTRDLNQNVRNAKVRILGRF